MPDSDPPRPLCPTSAKCISYRSLLFSFIAMRRRLCFFVRLKHPPNTKFIVQRPVCAKESVAQRIGNFRSFREPREQTFQLRVRTTTEIKANRIATNWSSVWHQPVRRRNLHIAALQTCIQDFILLDCRHLILDGGILDFDRSEVP